VSIRGKVRRAAKWGGTVATVLVAGVLVVSMWWGFYWAHGWSLRRWVHVGAAGGCVFVAWHGYTKPRDRPFVPHFDLGHVSGPVAWLPIWQRHPSLPTLMIIVPLWIPVLLVGAPTAWLWWWDRRVPAGHCRGCRYDLTGNTTGICPECGAAAAQTRPVDGVRA
jgi:hypothetical protein